MSKGLFGIFLKQGVGRNENYHKAFTSVILGNFLGLFPGNIKIFIFSFSLRTLQKNRFFFFFLISSDVPLFEIFFSFWRFIIQMSLIHCELALFNF